MVSVCIVNWNGRDYLPVCLDSVYQQDYHGEIEIIIVDNLSTDGTREQLVELERCENIQVIYQVTNKGKGHSVRKAIPLCTGDLVIPQDADLEYDPSDYKRLIDKLIKELDSLGKF